MTQGPTFQSPAASPGAAPRKADLFTIFVQALTVGAIATQIFLVIWLGSR